ncbi:MAG TPA: tetratricopeptide repeat protein, partial [Hanamia sp.]|nr:tetratricopeptide repeat protein [Hanamia sp.]
MKRKEFIIIIIVLIVAFAGITIVKNFGSTTVNNSSNTVTKSDSIQTFWNYYNRATQYRLQGKTDSSINAYQQAIRLNPFHKDALYYIGIMYMKADSFEKAHQSWEKLIGMNPESERAYNQLGNLYFCITDKNYF